MSRSAKPRLTWPIFPNGQDRSTRRSVARRRYARKEMTSEEFATYDDLLKELAAQSDNVPWREIRARCSQ